MHLLIDKTEDKRSTAVEPVTFFERTGLELNILQEWAVVIFISHAQDSFSQVNLYGNTKALLHGKESEIALIWMGIPIKALYCTVKSLK